MLTPQHRRTASLPTSSRHPRPVVRPPKKGGKSKSLKPSSQDSVHKSLAWRPSSEARNGVSPKRSGENTNAMPPRSRRPRRTDCAREADRERSEARKLIESVEWTPRMCIDTARAVGFDIERAVQRETANLRSGKVRAADRRLVAALEACSSAASGASEPAWLGDHDEARRVMLAVYVAWNDCRGSLGLDPVCYGLIPLDARRRLEAGAAEQEARRAAALVWTDEACGRVDAAVEADARRLARSARHGLRSFVGGWRISGINGDRLVGRDKEMRNFYKAWNTYRERLRLKPVPYGQLPNGEVLAEPNGRKKH